MPTIPCVSEGDLRAYVFGDLAEGDARAVAVHLDACPHCEAAARRLDDVTDPLIRRLRRAPGASISIDHNGPIARSISPTMEGERRAVAQAGAPPCVTGYEILEELGRGGMSVVYKVRQIRPERLVALKMLLYGSLAGPARVARIVSEADAIARLQHPHIVQVFEVGSCDGLPYLALEYVDGGSLADRLAGAPWPAREAAPLVETLARAVHYAHGRGVVHRDLKPANVLLAADGTAKIADFGLAKQERRDLTATQAILGTPSYMAPEQAAGGRGAGPAVDVYALGAILYECLTGRPPFRAGTALETLEQARTHDPVAPSQLAPKMPRDLETICLKCLRKEPAKRYATAEALAADLRRFQAGEPITARPAGGVERAVRWARRRPALAALLGAVLLALVGLAILSAVALDRARKAQQETEKEKKARDYLVGIFELSDSRAQANPMTARQILDSAEKRIPTEFADQPELQSELQAAIERVYDNITRDAPLAMILEARGAVRLQSARESNRRAVPQALLYVGDHLSLGADAEVRLVVLSDMHQEWLRPGREATVRRKGCEPADAIAERSEEAPWTFVRLPKGTFYMGWGRDRTGNGSSSILKDEEGMILEGVETVIPEDFEIAVHDVTQGQWQAVMGENPCWFSRFGQGRDVVKTFSDEELKLFPVESISWEDAQEFIKKLNEKERGRGYCYRLPTEAEWEYACRGGAASKEECSHHFYFDQPTNELSSEQANFHVEVKDNLQKQLGTNDLSSEQANFNGASPFGNAPKGKYLGRPTRVGAYPSNQLGLCDMQGDVEQWCADPVQNSGRIYRGGGWNRGAGHGRAAARIWGSPILHSNSLGFRLARVPVR